MIPPGFVSLGSALRKMKETDADARGRLDFVLRTGGLKVFRFDFEGTQKSVPAEFWKTARDEGENTALDAAIAVSDSHDVAPYIIRKADLAGLLIPDDAVNGSEPSSEGKAQQAERAAVDANRETQVDPALHVSRGAQTGRPPMYDWDAIWAGIALAVHNGATTSQAAMIDEVSRWYEKHFGEAPSRASLQPRIKRMLALLNEADPSLVFPKKSQAPRK